MRRIKYWLSGFGAAAILLCVGLLQHNSGLMLGGAFLALLGVVGLAADLRSGRE